MGKDNSYIVSGIFVICVLLCFILSIVSYAKFKNSDYRYVASLGKNWSTGPISDLEVGGYECPPGKISIINDVWPGTDDGCICRGLLFDNLKKGRCGGSRSEHNCYSISPINPVQLKKWRSTNICGKRGPNYLKLKTSESANGCGANYKNCGVVDSLKHYLCYPNNTPCPINDMKIVGKNVDVPKDKNYKILPLGNNGNEGKVVFSNEFTNQKVINEFRTDDNTPCLSPEYKNLNHKPYRLEHTWGHDTCSNDIGGKYHDKDYVKVDTETYNQLYQENGIFVALTSLPNFEKYNYLQSNTNLFYKNYIGMNKKCFEKMITKQTEDQFLSEILNIRSNIESTQSAAMFGMVLNIIGLVILIVMVLVFIFSKVDSDNMFWMIPCMLLNSLVSLIVGSIIVGIINAHNFDLTPLAQPGCTDPITESALLGFTSTISSGKGTSAAMLSFGLISLIVGAFGLAM